MSVETEITITCTRCGRVSAPDDYEQFCSKVNLPSVEFFNSFGIKIGRNVRGTGIHSFDFKIEISEKTDLCPECHKWVSKFFEEQANNIKTLLTKEWEKWKKK